MALVIKVAVRADLLPIDLDDSALIELEVVEGARSFNRIL